jgi:ring-1,2-phenylacetyl-CoA epoxidase subunit PaaC
MAVIIGNPALRELPPELRAALGDLLLFLADSELVIGHRHSEWTGFAPSAEEDVAFSSIAQDEMGHAHLYYALIAGADDEEAVDRLALDRGPRALRHLALLHAPNGDWFFTTARHLYWDVFEAAFLRVAKEADLPLLPSAARRVENEEVYHLEHATEWLELLSARPIQRRRLARELQRAAGIAGATAQTVPGLARLAAAGRFAAPEQLGENFAADLTQKLEAAGWSEAELGPVRQALRAAPADHRHPPGLYDLHRDLTGLRRAHAGASW